MFQQIKLLLWFFDGEAITEAQLSESLLACCKETE